MRVCGLSGVWCVCVCVYVSVLEVHGSQKKIVEEISDIYATLKLQSKAESSFSSD